MKRVGIIGGDEFLGCFVTLKFLAENFQVKVPLSSSQQEKKIASLSVLYANRNLELCQTNLEEYSQLLEFILDCQLVIHCGFPVKLGANSNGSLLYIPVIKGTAQLVKALKEAPNVEKVIFITSPAVFSISSFNESLKGNKLDITKTIKKKHFENARFHAEQALQNTLDFFPENFFDTVLVSPVEVKNNEITSNGNSTLAGLKFLFRNKIENDTVFQKIFRRNVLQTMANAADLHEWVFEAATKREMA